MNLITDQEIEKLVQDKLSEAYGRGVTDGGDLYNALLDDMMHITQKALAEILKEALKK